MHNALSKHAKPLFLLAVCAVASLAQAFGADVAAFIAAHPAIGGLAILGLAGETEVITKAGIDAALGKISDQVKELGEKALAEAAKGLAMSTAQKDRIDEILVKQGELQARQLELEQKAARRGGTGGDDRPQSAGEQLAGSPELKAALENGWGKKSRVSISVKTITSLPASAGQAIAPDRQAGVQMLPERRLTVRDLISPGTTSSNLIEYLQETGFTNNAAPTGEGERKPQSDIKFELKDAKVTKIPHFIKATSEILADFPALQSIIDERLRYGLKLVEEAQLLKGSGIGLNLLGLLNVAKPYVAPIVIPDATRIDVLRLALLQAELAEYPSTGIVLNPADWTAVELTKDDNGGYIFANPQSLAQPGLWGRPVVTTQAMTVDQFLVGAFRLGAQVFDRQQANVTVATENEDDFLTNHVTILAEERLALAIYRPEAFVQGDLTP